MIVSLIVLTLISNEGTDFLSISYITEEKEKYYSELHQLCIWTFHKNPVPNSRKSLKILILKGKATHLAQNLKESNPVTFLSTWNLEIGTNQGPFQVFQI